MIFIRFNSNINKRNLILLHVLPALMVFIAMMVIILLNAQSIQRQGEIEKAGKVAQQAEQLEGQIHERIIAYEEIARAVSAFIHSSDDVSKEDYKEFISTFRLTDRYPGVQYIAYAPFVSTNDVSSFIESQQQSIDPNYSISPDPSIAGDRDKILPIVFYEPETDTNRAVLGFDVLSEPIRFESIQEAINTGEAQISQNVQLVSSTTKEQAFVLYVPVYSRNDLPNNQESRQQAAVGITGVAFVSNTFFKNFETNEKDLVYQISQGTNLPMYKSKDYDSFSSKPGTKSIERTFSKAGRTWDIRYVYDAGILGSKVSTAAISSILSGTIFATLLAILVFVLLLSRTKSLNHAEEREIQNAKDDLLSLASHQLRTPATSVKQYLGMIKDGYAGDLTEQQSSLLNEAYVSNERQLSIINEMLYVARADAGRIVLDRSTLHLNRLLRDIHKDQFNRAKAYKQRLNLIVPKMDISISGDPHYLRMAIENIISNAIKYTPEGGNITVKLSRVKQDAIISITDDGVGIAKKDHKKIFGKFSRIPNELSTRTNGTGVGLYLTKQIIELHGGTITFTSENGKGTTFIITLPKLENN